MIALAVVNVSPADNPDTIIAQATFSGDYGTQGVGDLLNLAPYDVQQNPGGMTNPKNIPLPSIPAGLEVAPGVYAENLGGDYVQVNPLSASGATNGVAKTLAAKNGIGLLAFVPATGELTTGEAYPAAFIAAGAGVLLRIQLPHDQG